MSISRRHLFVALGLALLATASLIAPAAATTEPPPPHRTIHRHAARTQPARPHASHATAKPASAKRTGQLHAHTAATHRRPRHQTPQTPQTPA